jgi:Cft2 family RNA processing exonuclease
MRWRHVVLKDSIYVSQQILSQPDEIVSQSGAKLPLRLSVEYISFSAHVDFAQNSQFIEEVASPNLVCLDERNTTFTQKN